MKTDKPRIYSASEIVENVGRGLFLPQTAWIRLADLNNLIRNMLENQEFSGYESAMIYLQEKLK